MKSKISKRLTWANAIILMVALLIFCILSIFIFNVYLRRNIKEQLIRENTTAFRLAQLSIAERIEIDEETGRRDFSTLRERIENYQQPIVYKTLAESISIILISTENGKEYEVMYPSIDEFDADYNLEYIKKRLSLTNDNVIQVNMNSVAYFLTMEQSEPVGLQQYSLAAISLIPLSSIREINSRYIMLFLITTAFLVLMAFAIISIMSNKITIPIIKLKNLTKQYAKRDFNNKYIANTNDEIADLSKAVSEMAISLENHDRQREKMFRNISHELKTPLTAIYGYAEGIKNGIFSSPDEPLDIIMSESLRIKKLTENIIYLSKLENNIEVFKLERADISDIMVKAIHSIESLAIMNDIDIRFVPPDVERIDVDKDKIYRALINILSNCVKYTKDSIDVEINETQSNIEIIISDNGSGFKKEDIDTLLSGMTKEKSNGSGIGLSIVNEIVRGHKGRFVIANSKNGGAVFTIILNKYKKTDQI